MPSNSSKARAADPHPPHVLVSVEELRSRIESDPALVLLDVRWKLGEADGRRLYDESHLPGAVYVDLDSELASPSSSAGGRHPLPALDALQRAARRWGISDQSSVVIYDDNNNLSAARAWWLLRWGGLTSVWLLDGGLAAWRGAGHALHSTSKAPRAGDVVLTGGGMPVLDADDADDLARDGILLDARAGERFRGESEPIDPRAGHIPGATSAPTVANLRVDGAFKDPADLLERFRALGVDGSVPVGVYCGSGVTAAHEIAALTIAGLDGALYPGSWSQWAADPARPLAVGD
jgi:thiosulfate/3-mercaptopyruvate sulfurtransferase